MGGHEVAARGVPLFPPLLVYLGLHVVKREVIFVDLALAQVATLGTCVALFMGHHFDDRITFWISLGVTFVGAAFFSWSRNSRKRRGATGGDHRHHVRRRGSGRDSAAESRRGRKGRTRASAHRRHSQRHERRDRPARLCCSPPWPRSTALSTSDSRSISSDPEQAATTGISVRLWDFLFYAAFALVVVSFVRVAGVLLTFAYLSFPRSAGRCWRSDGLAASWLDGWSR